MDGSKFESDMSRKNEKIIMAVFSITFAMLWILFFMQIAVINECQRVHEGQQEVIEKEKTCIDSLTMRNDILWDKLIELKFKER